MELAVYSVLVLVAVGVTVHALNAYRLSRGYYGEYTDDLDPKLWSLKDYLHIGFYLNAKQTSLLEKIPILSELWQGYQNRIYAQILTLYGYSAGQEKYYYVHQANKTTFQLLAACFFTWGAPLFMYSNHGQIGKGLQALCIGIAVTLLLPLLLDKELETQLKDREKQIAMEFPDFANRYLLLVGAGMSSLRAMRRIVNDDSSDSYLYRELRETLKEIDGGKAETAAYEDLGRRCMVRVVARFMSALVQNLNKGSVGLVAELRGQIAECWEARKAAAKTMGADISTKLVLPLMVSMLGVMLLLAAPAVTKFMSM